MAVTHTASSLEFDNETYRANEEPQKSSLRFRVGAEYTAAGSTRSVSTDDAQGDDKVRLTNRFGRNAIRNTQFVARIIDDIKQRFSGVVTAIDVKNEEFTARVSDLLSPDNPDELITLGFDEIQLSDVRQLAIGDSFVWYIGYVQGPMISREGFSKIRFRRLPAWSQQEIEKASDEAKELFDFFRGHTDTTA